MTRSNTTVAGTDPTGLFRRQCVYGSSQFWLLPGNAVQMLLVFASENPQYFCGSVAVITLLLPFIVKE